MEQHELRPPRGAKKNRKRIGRGNASGHGTYSGKGLKGQQARSGYKTRPAFEGGQTPMVRRLPRRRGFTNPFRVEYQPVNLRDLAAFAVDGEVTPESLQKAGVIRSIRQPVKLLGDGEVTAALTVKTHRVSATARAKIEAAGGTVEELTPRKEPSEKRQRGKKQAAPVAKKEDTPKAEKAAKTSTKDDAPKAKKAAKTSTKDDAPKAKKAAKASTKEDAPQAKATKQAKAADAPEASAEAEEEQSDISDKSSEITASE